MSAVFARQSKPRSSVFTCLACQVEFNAADLQRAHYNTDWHRYNLKRRVVELPPVTAQAFADKLLAQQAQSKSEADKASYVQECVVCSKLFYSKNTYANHLKSNKHKLAEERAARLGGSVKPPSKRSTVTKTEDVSEVDTNIATAPKLDPETDCLFCSAKSLTFDENIKHMTKVHSFFIPDGEYLTDIHGLIKYLSEKVTVGNVCLYCNGRGKGMRSLEAVRMHMIDKGHCMIAYSSPEDAIDISDYYDFTSSYPDEEWEDVDDDGDDTEEPSEVVEIDEDDELPKELFYMDGETELVLPSGAHIGHRLFHRYYKQYLRPREQTEKAPVNRLITHHTGNFGYRSGILIATAQSGSADKATIRSALKHRQRQQEFDTRIGIKANRLQKHYRAQIL